MNRINGIEELYMIPSGITTIIFIIISVDLGILPILIPIIIFWLIGSASIYPHYKKRQIIIKKIAYLLTSNETFTYFETFKIKKETDGNCIILFIPKDLEINTKMLKKAERLSGHKLLSFERNKLIFLKNKNITFTEKEDLSELLKIIKALAKRSLPNLKGTLKNACETDKILLGFIEIKQSFLLPKINIIFDNFVTGEKKKIATLKEMVYDKSLIEALKEIGLEASLQSPRKIAVSINTSKSS